MPIYLGNNAITPGGMTKVYLGSNQVWTAAEETPVYTNLLSEKVDPNMCLCESKDFWVMWNISDFQVDNTNQFAGAGCLKIFGIYGSMYRGLSASDFSGKYVMLSGYLKNYNLTDMTVRVNNYADFPASPVVTATNTWTRTGVLMQPSQMTDNFDVMVYVDGTDAAQYGFVDNIMLNYISAEDHAQGLAYCLNKYPWKV